MIDCLPAPTVMHPQSSLCKANHTTDLLRVPVAERSSGFRGGAPCSLTLANAFSKASGGDVSALRVLKSLLFARLAHPKFIQSPVTSWEAVLLGQLWATSSHFCNLPSLSLSPTTLSSLTPRRLHSNSTPAAPQHEGH